MQTDDGSAFGTGGFERLKRGAQLIPELGAEALSLLFVVFDRMRDLFFRLRINADQLRHRAATRAASRR